MSDLPVDLTNEINDPALSGSDTALGTSTEVPPQNLSTTDILNGTIVDTTATTESGGMSTGTIVGIIAGVVVLVGGIGAIFMKGSSDTTSTYPSNQGSTM